MTHHTITNTSRWTAQPAGLHFCCQILAAFPLIRQHYTSAAALEILLQSKLRHTLLRCSCQSRQARLFWGALVATQQGPFLS
ncbi:unnamed protein product [Peronospora belbahrii]|uniref:Uncharacterized protein n=1 Tax=Peronospora belbahrii TaxID=622444 RepID=A0AAU9L2E4_9STRA|nr:unnamed protein product [Peronospora belbahrii]